MNKIYDNIESNLVDSLKESLIDSKRGDFCVGYFNLRGWKSIASAIDTISAEEGNPSCRLIVGMYNDNSQDQDVREYYNNSQEETTQGIVVKRKHAYAKSLAEQLTYGIPTDEDEKGLRKLAQQLRNKTLQVKFFGSHPLHAKLYLAHKKTGDPSMIGYVGSSNLTLAGLKKQAELNVDIVDAEATKKLAQWFEARWNDHWCLDISEELADIIEESWAGGPIEPYEIYIKTAYELSKEAIEGSREFNVPKEFRDKMLEFQVQAVTLAAQRLNKHRGVMISDVVGLGKTLVASAVAKTFQMDHGGNVLVICPPHLQNMWQNYFHEYEIAGDVLSIGKTKILKDKPRFHTVIIDESHNLRNRESTRYSEVKDYIDNNDCRVILLTATPYNKEFKDIANQLRFFVDPNSDLGTRPEAYIKSLIDEGGNFNITHPTTLISSLAAFEQSEEVDDWRELIRAFMVRRTRSHIKNTCPLDEERNQSYLTFSSGKRYYFPDRVPKCANFEMSADEESDQYASLYSDDVVKTIEELKLPRYGMKEYLRNEYRDSENDAYKDLSKDQQKIISNLTRAGNRLIGFTRSNLFKRLESSGPAFLSSLKRHIVRNAIHLAAIEENGDFPIGDVYDLFIDKEEEDDLFNKQEIEGDGIDSLLDTGKRIYNSLTTPFKNGNDEKFDFIHTDLFKGTLKEHLLSDCDNLYEILKIAPEWKADSDRKLNALCKLCEETHGDEKILIFTQFKDTAEYISNEMVKRKMEKVALVHSGVENIENYVERFSPVSNNKTTKTLDEIRILVTTDSLSEGQNLQDCRVVINFDMPWATIRLIQRVGRVDRIGQQARQIFCYCFLPEDGIEKVIGLRERLAERISQNAEVVGSDERFFEGAEINLEQIYNENLSLEDEEDETDLVSYAYDVWQQATRDDPPLKERIEKLPDVVYSAKSAGENKKGVLAYIKTARNQHILIQVDKQGEVISQSQSKVLELLECGPNEPTKDIARNHHELVSSAVEYIKKIQLDIGGQLGGVGSIKRRVYTMLTALLENQEGTLFYSEDLKQVVEQIYRHSFRETARDKLGRLLRQGINEESLANIVLGMWEHGELLALPKGDEPIETSIICSMGLVE